MDTAISLYHELLNTKENIYVLLLLSGGISNQDVPISEAEVMRKYCVDNQIPEDKTIMENESLDTIGNAFFTRNIADSIKNVTSIYVVSSCYHMQRAKYIFGMCYGAKYKLHFKNCNLYSKIRVDVKEKSSLMLAYDFFKDIDVGDVGAIEKRLFTYHKLYVSNPGNP